MHLTKAAFYSWKVRVATLVAKNIHFYQLCRLAMHAAVAAQSYQTRVLTQLVYTSCTFETFRQALGRPGCLLRETLMCTVFSIQGQAANSNVEGTRGEK